jgi:AmmeMemoRadiSam system protein B
MSADGGEEMMEKFDLRPSPIAGQWYPGDPNRLASSVDDFISKATIQNMQGTIIGIIAPHAGYAYSGPVAGYAFAAVRGLKPEIVAVISPMHQPYHEPLLTTGHDAYQTPLGSIPIDKGALELLDDLLISDLGFGTTPVHGDREHSLEIELPFLQRALEAEFTLLPVMVRDQSTQVAQSLGKSLAQTLKGRHGLLVASTDLSHFYPQRTANKYDRELLNRIESFDPNAVLKAEEEKKGFACGRAAVAAVLWAAQELGADQVQILNYATSGDVSGDYYRVVGYGAAVIMKSRQEA